MREIDVISTGGYPSAVLSNFYEHPFTLEGEHSDHMEGFIQSLKHDNILAQRQMRRTKPRRAKYLGRSKQYDAIYFKDNVYQIGSPEHHQLLDDAYDAMFEQNDAFRKALKATSGAKLTHKIGTSSDSQIITAEQFIQQLYRLRDKL